MLKQELHHLTFLKIMEGKTVLFSGVGGGGGPKVRITSPTPVHVLLLLRTTCTAPLQKKNDDRGLFYHAYISMKQGGTTGSEQVQLKVVL